MSHASFDALLESQRVYNTAISSPEELVPPVTTKVTAEKATSKRDLMELGSPSSYHKSKTKVRAMGVRFLVYRYHMFPRLAGFPDAVKSVQQVTTLSLASPFVTPPPCAAVYRRPEFTCIRTDMGGRFGVSWLGPWRESGELASCLAVYEEKRVA